jgi:phosphoribosyl 1,2-cyclic phosphodiesterase
MADELRVKFWGVRGSHPAPGAGTVKYGGNTASVEVRAGGRTILLDAGTGIIPLGRELAREHSNELLLLFSHLHHDHIQGFPFFLPAYLPGTHLHVFGPGGTPETLRRVLEQNQSAAIFPVSLRDMASSKDIQSVHESQMIIWDETGIRAVDSPAGWREDSVLIRIHKSYAHPGGVYIYRIGWRGKSVVYATDTEGYVGTDRRLVQFARDSDVLIHDAQYLEQHYRGQLAAFPATQGYGHSTVTMACDVASAAEVGQLVLFHHDPSYSDATVKGMEVFAQRQFPEARAAHEGLEIKLPAVSAARLPSLAVRQRDVKYAHHD